MLTVKNCILTRFDLKLKGSVGLSAYVLIKSHFYLIKFLQLCNYEEKKLKVINYINCSKHFAILNVMLLAAGAGQYISEEHKA